MLQSRSPLYLVNYLKYGNKAMSDKYREAYLFRVQYQTHRNMNQALKEIRALRKAKKVQVSGFKIDLLVIYSIEQIPN